MLLVSHFLQAVDEHGQGARIKYGKSLSAELFNDEVLKENNNDTYIKQIADISNERGQGVDIL